ncbi:MAG: YccF domain-containing protein [Oscillospiraceae bacterium]|nr:YccF domain-containing protein [Oscillospiraceae bacterium]
MTLLGNIIWLLCGGLISGLCWAVYGLLWSLTIIGIPVGKQCFKLAALSLCPFGKEVVNEGGGGSCLINAIWMLVTGIEMALAHCAAALVLCVTVIGIPFGMQHFKLAGLSLAPFGKRVVPKE